ncbi:MAG: hypothetical protein R2856_01555 [Caldilineaceae bacterium]
MRIACLEDVASGHAIRNSVLNTATLIIAAILLLSCTPTRPVAKIALIAPFEGCIGRPATPRWTPCAPPLPRATRRAWK